jgi:uncharacterized protein YqjF (DUF2071 family)
MTGIWFFSLDAARLAAVTAARTSWGLPYYWATMEVRRDADHLTYTSTRKPPGPPAESAIEIAAAAEMTDPGAFDNYLTARFVLWARQAGRLWYTRAEHPPWQLRQATVQRMRGSLLTAAGLPAPAGNPVVHFSDGVAVRVGLPRPVG